MSGANSCYTKAMLDVLVDWNYGEWIAQSLRHHYVEDTQPIPLYAPADVRLFTQDECEVCEGTGKTVDVILLHNEEWMPAVLPCKALCDKGKTMKLRAFAHVYEIVGDGDLLLLENIELIEDSARE